MKNIFYLIAVVVGLMFAHIVDATEPMQMTMTLKPDGEVRLMLAGSGKVIIDWGDGLASETRELSPLFDERRKSSSNYVYRHAYYRKTIRTITITGENITHMECYNNQLKRLDVSKNIVLTYLNCCRNQLTSLDVSKNTILKELDCTGNRLSKLDVGNNTELVILGCRSNKISNLDLSENTSLTILDCSFNKLKDLNINNNIALKELVCWRNSLRNLDVSKNTALMYLNCDENQLSTAALNALFGTLHSNPIVGKTITMRNYLRTDTCDWMIAVNKGWTVRYIIWDKEEEIVPINAL